ncbi:hypothetical protein M0R45_005489 [Rubus argutus]|uniref:Uncharacterized protein n=1 Tax=Rubus argutus TaxID=59490 RepID=A0AAW1YMU2_RUBAR
MQRTCLKSTQQFVQHTDLSTLTWAPVVARFSWDIVFRNSRDLVPGEVVKALGRYARQRRWRVVGLMTSSYLSWFVAQGGSGRMMKFSRDKVFNRLLYNSICNVIHLDCGKLPNMSSNDSALENGWKED